MLNQGPNRNDAALHSLTAAQGDALTRFLKAMRTRVLQYHETTPGQYLGQCPLPHANGDAGPSLSFGLGERLIGVTCHGPYGHQPEQIIKALGLTKTELYYDDQELTQVTTSTTDEVSHSTSAEVAVRRPGVVGHRKLSVLDQRKLMRALAVGEVKRSLLARQFGVSGPYVTQFAKLYAREIDEIRGRLDDEFAALWIASKEARIAAAEYDHQLSMDSDRSGHFEQIRTRILLRQEVAEELGQLPPRQQQVVVPVIHVVQGVNTDALT